MKFGHFHAPKSWSLLHLLTWFLFILSRIQWWTTLTMGFVFFQLQRQGDRILPSVRKWHFSTISQISCISPQVCIIVYYVPGHIMRVITRWATMLAGDRSQGIVEAYLRQSRGAISPASILSESRNYPNRVHWHIFYFMWLRCVYEFLCVHSNLI